MSKFYARLFFIKRIHKVVSGSPLPIFKVNILNGWGALSRSKQGINEKLLSLLIAVNQYEGAEPVRYVFNHKLVFYSTSFLY
jgi:hypothetical protein